jgi:hypothetical protein
MSPPTSGLFKAVAAGKEIRVRKERRIEEQTLFRMESNNFPARWSRYFYILTTCIKELFFTDTWQISHNASKY